MWFHEMVADFLYSHEESSKEERMIKYDQEYEEAKEVFGDIRDEIRDFIWGENTSEYLRKHDRIASEMAERGYTKKHGGKAR